MKKNLVPRMHNCISCSSNLSPKYLQIPKQPPSNRFQSSANEQIVLHDLIVAQCMNCALIQLVDPMTIDEIKARYDWISYNEPERHLDEVVQECLNLPDLNDQSKFIGLTYKDQTTLDRLVKLGWGNGRIINFACDFGNKDNLIGLETFQELYATADKTSALEKKYGKMDFIIVRHILEHAHKPINFLSSIRNLVRDGGYFVIEVPDNKKMLENKDYCYLWEEHICYFTKDTIVRLLEMAGLRVIYNVVFPYEAEDTIVVIAQKKKPTSSQNGNIKKSEIVELNEFEVFKNSFEKNKVKVQETLFKLRQQNKRVALFGASHLCAKFINFNDISSMIECVIDDHPEKQGLFMPLSGVPIVSSASLSSLDVCLLTLNPESEEKVRKKYKDFSSSGGQFLSIFNL